MSFSFVALFAPGGLEVHAERPPPLPPARKEKAKQAEAGALAELYSSDPRNLANPCWARIRWDFA